MRLVYVSVQYNKEQSLRAVSIIRMVKWETVMGSSTGVTDGIEQMRSVVAIQVHGGHQHEKRTSGVLTK